MKGLWFYLFVGATLVFAVVSIGLLRFSEWRYPQKVKPQLDMNALHRAMRVLAAERCRHERLFDRLKGFGDASNKVEIAPEGPVLVHTEYPNPFPPGAPVTVFNFCGPVSEKEEKRISLQIQSRLNALKKDILRQCGQDKVKRELEDLRALGSMSEKRKVLWTNIGLRAWDRIRGSGDPPDKASR